MVERVFTRLQQEQILALKIEVVSLDSTSIQVHPDGTGARKKRTAIYRQVARGQEHQGSSGVLDCSVRPEAGALPRSGGRCSTRTGVAAGAWTRSGARLPFVHGPRLRRQRNAPPRRGTGFCARRAAHPNRVEPWEYDRVTYRRRNEVERIFSSAQGATDACLPATTNSMCSSLPSFTSRSSWMPCVNVNRP